MADMKMTLEYLNRYLELRSKYLEALSIVRQLENAGVKSPVISDMPKGSGSHDRVCDLAMEIYDLRKRSDFYLNEVRKLEDEVQRFIGDIGDDLTRTAFRLRYVHCMKWDEVAKVVGGGNTEQSIKMMCYRYLSK